MKCKVCDEQCEYIELITGIFYYCKNNHYNRSIGKNDNRINIRVNNLIISFDSPLEVNAEKNFPYEDYKNTLNAAKFEWENRPTLIMVKE
jgi:hypothetical protein